MEETTAVIPLTEASDTEAQPNKTRSRAKAPAKTKKKVLAEDIDLEEDSDSLRNEATNAGAALTIVKTAASAQTKTAKRRAPSRKSKAVVKETTDDSDVEITLPRNSEKGPRKTRRTTRRARSIAASETIPAGDTTHSTNTTRAQDNTEADITSDATAAHLEAAPTTTEASKQRTLTSQRHPPPLIPSESDASDAPDGRAVDAQATALHTSKKPRAAPKKQAGRTKKTSKGESAADDTRLADTVDEASLGPTRHSDVHCASVNSRTEDALTPRATKTFIPDQVASQNDNTRNASLPRPAENVPAVAMAEGSDISYDCPPSPAAPESNIKDLPGQVGPVTNALASEDQWQAQPADHFFDNEMDNPAPSSPQRDQEEMPSSHNEAPSAALEPPARHVRALPRRVSSPKPQPTPLHRASETTLPTAASAASLPQTFPRKIFTVPQSTYAPSGRSALDELLAGPVPDFASPEKTFIGPSTALVPISPDKGRSANTTNSQDVPLDDWLQTLVQLEVDKFSQNARDTLRQWDEQVTRRRQEVSRPFKVHNSASYADILPRVTCPQLVALVSLAA